MAETIPGLMGFVVRNLKADPGASSRELYERSRSRYPEVGDLSLRQFHARYPLQAKRQLNRPVVRRFPLPGRDGRSRTAASEGAGDGAARPVASHLADEAVPPGPPHEAIRLLLFRLALDLETARTRAELVDFVAGMDRYVDEALKIGAAAKVARSLATPGDR